MAVDPRLDLVDRANPHKASAARIADLERRVATLERLLQRILNP